MTAPPTDHTRKFTHRRDVRVAAAFLLTLAMLLPLAFLFARFWDSTGADRDFVRDERRGVAYLRPLTRLLGSLTEAQSTAVAGKKVEVTAIRSAMGSVDGVDRAEGDALRASQRWDELRTRIDTVVTRSPKGADAYRAYSEVTDLTVDLMLKIGDTSKLILDPELDSYYLMEATLLRLPQVLVNAGRVADLSVLAGQAGDVATGTGNTGDNTGNTGDATGTGGQPGASEANADSSVRLAIARDRVASATAAIHSGLSKSFRATGSEKLGPNLVGPLDAFRTAADRVAPTSALIDVGTPRLAPETVSADRDALQRAALQFGDTVLIELDGLLADRADRIDGERTTAPVTLALGALVAVGILWLRLPRAEALRTDAGVPAGVDDTLLSDHVAEPTPERPAARTTGGPEDYELLDARDLLAAVELVRVGRAVKPRPQEPDDDSQ